MGIVLVLQVHGVGNEAYFVKILQMLSSWVWGSYTDSAVWN